MKALILVDIQNDFCPGGALAVENGDAILPAVNRLIEGFTEQNLPVFLTRDWHPENHCSFIDFGGIWPAHCIASTEGAAFRDGLNVPETASIISKADRSGSDAYSGFEGTDLDRRLRGLGVDELIIAGLATDYCVKNTVLDAIKLKYKTHVAVDGIMAVNVNPGDGKEAETEMAVSGAVLRNSADLLTAF